MARIAFLTITVFSICTQTFAAQTVGIRAGANRIIVRPKPGVTTEHLEKLQGNRRILKRFNALGGLTVVRVEADKMEQALETYRASGMVEFAEPDFLLRASVVPNDPHFSSGLQWSLLNSTTGRDIHATEGWDTISSASNIVVAVVDSGIRYTHEDLAANMWRNPGEVPNNGLDDDNNGLVDDYFGINTVDGSGNPMDDGDHGTHVAGIIGAVGNNGKGIAGVAWSVKLMACKFLDVDGVGFTSDAIEAIDYARRMGAHVINASFGGEDYSNALFAAIQSARSAGIIFVTAAGNDQLNIDNFPTYPACYGLDNIVVVGGSSRFDTFDSTYSNYGVGDVDLFAPGTTVYSTWGSSDTAYLSSTGTSMAAPHVTGAVALMKARFTNLTTGQILDRLYASVDVLPSLSNRCRTGGRLNLAKALGPNPAANFSASSWIGEPPLNVAFSNLSVGEVKSYLWDFGDGSAPSTNAAPSHVFARVGAFNVRLTVMGTNGKSNSLAQVVRVNSNYQFRPEPYGWVDPNGMLRLPLSDNGVSPAQTLPFEFNFYGEPRSALYVSANGIVGFSPDGLANIDNVSMPIASAPNAIIAPFWDNLNPAAGGTVYAGATGTSPNRRYVVSWVNVPRVANGAFLSFQMILEENTGEIVFQFREVEGSRGGGRSATIGLENTDGNTAALYSYNGSPNLLANRSAVRAGRKVFRYLVVDRHRLSFDSSISNVVLALENVGNTNLSWGVGSSSSWITASSPEGTLTGGESTQVQIELTPEALTLAPGSYETTIQISNLSDGGGDVSLPVTFQVEPASSGVLEFTNAGSDLFTGGFGGPFAPASLAVQLRNSGNAALDWGGTVNASWVTLEPALGRLDPGESATVLLGISSNANSLAAGSHAASATFENVSVPDAASFEQTIRLQVNARLESSSASILNGEFRADVAAPQPGNYAVEFSTDLIAWETLTTVSSVDGSVRFTDPETTGNQRFYRLRLL